MESTNIKRFGTYKNIFQVTVIVPVIRSSKTNCFAYPQAVTDIKKFAPFLSIYTHKGPNIHLNLCVSGHSLQINGSREKKENKIKLIGFGRTPEVLYSALEMESVSLAAIDKGVRGASCTAVLVRILNSK